MIQLVPRRLGLVLLTLVVTGCAGTTLPYAPERQPSGANVSAAYRIVGDRLRIEIDTDHRQLEEATIVKPDGTTLQAQTIEITPRVLAGSPVDFGLGVGSGSFGQASGVGATVGIGFPIGGGTTVTGGNTVVLFPAAEAGPPPWRLQVKLASIEPVTIVVGEAPSGSRP